MESDDAVDQADLDSRYQTDESLRVERQRSDAAVAEKRAAAEAEADVGLHISKCIVEAHGGRTWADSKLGFGSTFHFSLPTSPAPSAASGG